MNRKPHAKHGDRVEHPIGTGYTIGKPTATSEEEIATDFVGFFKNFQKTFRIKNFKIYITGELSCSFRSEFTDSIAQESHMQASGVDLLEKTSNTSDVGRYVPYISSAFLDQKDTSLFDIKGTHHICLRSRNGAISFAIRILVFDHRRFEWLSKTLTLCWMTINFGRNDSIARILSVYVPSRGAKSIWPRPESLIKICLLFSA